MSELRCPYCNKSCSSQSGMTNHIKRAHPTGTETQMEDPRDIDPRGQSSEPARHSRSTSTPTPTPTSPAPKQKSTGSGPFDIGAFLIFGEHIPIMLDLNFAAALSDHILKHGSDNRAVLAFGHQLSKASGDD